MSKSTFRYVVHERVPDYLRCGWFAHPSLEGSYHGQYSALLEWRCCCPMAEPTSSVSSPLGKGEA